MKAPWFMYVGSLSQLLPVATALVARSVPRGPRRWILLWVMLLLVADAVAYYFGTMHHQNNRWVSYVFTPLQALAVLWAMMQWQREGVARVAIRNSIPLVLVAVLGLSLFEDVNNFSRYTEPVLSVVALLVALYTLATRSADATEPLLQQDWFWICTGIALVYGATATLTPVAYIFVRTNPELVAKAYLVRLFVHLLAMLAICLGLLCPTSPRSSGISLPSPQSA